MYQKVNSQQQSSQTHTIMERKELMLIIMFSLNSWIYLQYDTKMKIAQALQCIVAFISIGFINHYGFRAASLPYVICMLTTGVLMGVSYYVDVDKYFMIIPFVFIVSVERIRRKLDLILEILLESLWMFFSIMFCFSMFGLISYYFFYNNKEYFQSPIQSTLTYLQVATLDQVGKISLLNYEKFGFFKAFITMILSLAIVHTLFNFNQAIIMQYVYRKRHHGGGGASTRNLFMGRVRKALKIVRILNVIVTPLVFLLPFYEQRSINWFIMALTIISTVCIIIQHCLQGDFFTCRNIMNVLLQIIIIFLFGTTKYLVFYFFCTCRIFLMKQVLNLWAKILQVVKQISGLFSITSFFFLIFSLLSYVLEKVQKQQTKMQVILIKSLQFLTLDDWTSHIRHNTWYMSLLIIIYIILLNHIFLNLLISQSFGEFRIQINQTKQDNKNLKSQEKQYQNEYQQKLDYVDQFWTIAASLGYQMNLNNSSLDILECQEVTFDLSINNVDDKTQNQSINSSQDTLKDES